MKVFIYVDRTGTPSCGQSLEELQAGVFKDCSVQDTEEPRWSHPQDGRIVLYVKHRFTPVAFIFERDV